MTLVYLAVAWAVGIWLARWAWSQGVLSCAAPEGWVWGIILAAPLAGLVISRWKPRWRLPAALGLFLALGALRFHLAPFTPCFTSADLAFHNGSLEQPAWATVTGVVQRPPELRDTRLRVRLRAESVTFDQDEEPLPVNGHALFTIDRYPGLGSGDRVAVRGRLEAPPVFEEFDYREYLARQGVHTMIQQPDVSVLSRGAGRGFWTRLYALRFAAQDVIARLLPEPEAGLLTGILLGVESGIDPALYDQFNRTGVSHIIVISGHITTQTL